MAQEDALARLILDASISDPGQPVRVLGIDLGTTNSTISELSWSPAEPNARARCIEINQPTALGVYTHVMVPSIVAIHDGQHWVGEGAKRLRAHTGKFGLRQNKNLFFDCKNEIGLDRTYHLALEHYRSPAEIGSHVLRFLFEAAEHEGFDRPDRTVITVPASFSIAQRRETLRAAELAGIKLEAGDLLDEPLAAFLDTFVTRGPADFQIDKRGKSLLVFDFGGGTCDIAVFKLQFEDSNQEMMVAPLAVSRYHRLGGGDIDAAIVFEVLLPQLLEQNELSSLDLTFDDKKNFVLPTLLDIAEALKIGLCTELQRLQEFGRLEHLEKQDIVKELPGQRTVEVKGRVLTLQSPRLNSEQFEKLLAPFVDRDLLYPRETEYRSSCSIFAPLSDAIERAHLLPEEIDYCLFVGGSSLIPQVRDVVSDYLCNATVLTYDDLGDIQTAVSKGAAYHALMLEVRGSGLFQPVAHDDISILTSAGLVPFVTQGKALPVMGTASLSVPQTTLLEPCNLRVEIRGGDAERRPVLSSVWSIPGPVSKGDELILNYSMDANQVLDLELRLASDAHRAPFKASIENPLTHVVNPLRERLRIDEREEALRRGEISSDRVADEFYKLAVSYVELGHREKALEYFSRSLRSKGTSDIKTLNYMGIVAGELRDYERQEKFYRDAAQAGANPVPLFNLAVSQRQQRRLSEAAVTIEEALAMQRAGEYLVLAGLIAREDGRPDDARLLFAEAKKAFPDISTMSDFELSWASSIPDPKYVARCRAERQRRSESKVASTESDALLPDLKGTLVRVSQ